MRHIYQTGGASISPCGMEKSIAELEAEPQTEYCSSDVVHGVGKCLLIDCMLPGRPWIFVP